MPNNNYINGRYKEYQVIKQLKKDGFNIAQRSAGSRSPIDIFAIHRDKRIIRFVQCKPKSMSETKKQALEAEHEWLKETFKCEFVVV